MSSCGFSDRQIGELVRMPVSADVFSQNLRELPAFRALLRAVEARLYSDIELPARTLDLGCGDGHFVSTAFYHPLDVGIDSNFNSVRVAYGKTGVYRGVFQAGCGRLPFGDQAFGSAICNSVLEHIPDLEGALHDIGRVLLTGAPFVFTVPSEFFCGFLSISRGLSDLGLRSMARAYERFFNRISRHYHYHSLEEWSVLLEDAGFSVERYRYYFSRRALQALEWWHYFGLPALVSKRLTGRWILSPTAANLGLTERILRRYYEEPMPARGAYLLLVARRVSE